jgi:CHASE2 domain-containing sensor protein
MRVRRREAVTRSRGGGGRALIVAALVAVSAAVALQATGALGDLERRSVATRFELRNVPAPDEVVLVGIDDVTFSDLERRWPFPRSLHAKVVDELRRAGARLVVYDVQFTEPTRPAEDFALYKALDRAGGAVLATTEVDSAGHTNVLGGDDNLRAIDAEAASSSLPVEANGVKSRFEHSVNKVETLAVAAARRAGGPHLDPSDFPDGSAWIDYRGGVGTFPAVSFSDVLQGRFEPGTFNDKVVVVGATAPSLQDVHVTPAGNDPMSGPEVQANAIWTALHGLPLHSAPPAIDLLITVLLTLLPIALTLVFSVVATSLLSACAGFAWAIAAQVLFASGTIVAFVAPVTGLALAAVLAIVVNNSVEAGARRRASDRAEELEQRVRERTVQLRETQLEIVQRLAQAADSRDEETGEHIDRIGRLCESLGAAVGLDAHEAELLRHAAAMHDVGKIGIPDRVLLKPAKLDAEEWELMKTHTTLGAQILSGSRSELLQLAEEIALTHHERWDGSGYPAGLAGEEIPLAGRICAVCDVYDALISERPYKKAWSREDALAEIRRGAGSHFDPQLAEAFLRLHEGPDEDPLAAWNPDPAAATEIRPGA